MTLIDALASCHTDRTALLSPDGESLSYAELALRARAASSRLLELGVAEGERVALRVPPGLESVVCLLGTSLAHTCVPVGPDLGPIDLRRHLSSLQASVLLFPNEDAIAREAARELRLGLEIGTLLEGQERAACEHRRLGLLEPQPALSLATSGTTASPKPVDLSHSQLLAAGRAMVEVLKLGAADRTLGLMPLHHIHGFSALLSTLISGGSFLCCDGREAHRLGEWLSRDVTWYTCSPTLHELILDSKPQVGELKLRFLRSASAAMSAECQQRLESYFGVPLIQAYGMTEAAPQIATNPLPPGVRKPGSVGLAAGPEIQVVDSQGVEQPANSPGEVQIRGENVVGEGWLRTGDLGYLDSDGYLFLQGRRDDVINRGGHKIAPRELDRTLVCHPAVAQAASFGVPDPVLGQQVGVALVLEAGGELDDEDRSDLSRVLDAYLRRRLAPYKIPTQYYFLDHLPISPTGKLRRRDLPKLCSGRPGCASNGSIGGCGPEGLATQVGEIWSQVLGLERELQPKDNFFHLGGESLKAARLVRLLNARLGVELPLATLFEHPTLKQFCALVEGNLGTRRYLLSSAQRSLAFVALKGGLSATHGVSASVRLQGKLDLELLKQSVRALQHRHPALRTLVELKPGNLSQSVVDGAAVELAVQQIPASQVEETLRIELNQSFSDFEQPLFRGKLLQVEENLNLLVLQLSHMICDGFSAELLRADLAAVYRSLETKQPTPEAPSSDFGAWVSQEQTWCKSRKRDEQLEFWRERLRGVAPLKLWQTPATPGQPRALPISLNPELTLKVDEIARSRGATPFMVLASLLQILLMRALRQHDITVGIPVANRPDQQWETVVGNFANLLPLRTRVDATLTFGELLEQVKASTLELQTNQRLPYEELLRELRLTRVPGQQPLVHVVFAYNEQSGVRHWSEDLVAEPVLARSPGSKFDLTLYLHRKGKQLVGWWCFHGNSDIETRVSSLSSGFGQLLEAVDAQSTDTLQELPLSIDFEDLARPFLQRFKELAVSTPTAVAIEQTDDLWTYSELDFRSNRLAHYLTHKGITHGSLVALHLPRTPWYLAFILALWKCRAAYLPLEHGPGTERAQRVLRLCSPDHIVSEGSYQTGGGLEVCLDRLDEELSSFSSSQPGLVLDPSDLAYVMTTSGSSGVPKTVRVSHSHLNYLAAQLPEALSVEGCDRYLHTAVFSFSASLRQFVVPFTKGATVVLADDTQRRDPEKLQELLEDKTVSVLDLVPTHWRTLLQSVSVSVPSVRLLLSASQGLSSHLARNLMQTFPEAQLINMYGLTETTGVCFTHRLSEASLQSSLVPMGRPLPGTVDLVLDSEGQPVAPEQDGELCLVGPGIAPGLGTPFKTGDRVRRDHHGVLHYLGRLDAQLKVRGHRLDPAEVERELEKHPQVSEAAVHMVDQSLVATVVAKGTEEPTGVIPFLRERLPAYMIPRRVNTTSTLPRTPSGKLARTRVSNGKSAVAVLQKVWCQVLDLPSVSPEDSFFDLGGDSLLSLQVVASAREMGLSLSLEDIFANHTLGALAARTDGAVSTVQDEPLLRVPPEALQGLLTRMLEKAGLESEGAQTVAQVQLESSLRGQPTHNIADIPRYVARLQRGTLKPKPAFRLLEETSSKAILDGDNGPGQWVATQAMQLAIKKATEGGFGVVLVRNSNHFGAAGHYPWLATQAGLIGLCFTNGPLILAPTGGVTPLFGNNPIAVGVPRREGHAVILDMALSEAPRGKIGLRLRQGDGLEPGWILDRRGRPSTRLEDLASGLGVPIGGHKGYGLALVTEILAGVLSGADFGRGHSRENLKRGAANLGHAMIAISPELFQATDSFHDRLEQLLTEVKTADRADGVTQIRLPGELELQTREENLRKGLSLTRVTEQALLECAKRLDLDPTPLG